GFSVVQLNLACAGLESLPRQLSPDVVDQIHACAQWHELEIAAVSGTFNAIHPDRARRHQCIRRCIELIRNARRMGTSVVTLCTGTRDPDDMWREHPDNRKS